MFYEFLVVQLPKVALKSLEKWTYSIQVCFVQFPMSDFKDLYKEVTHSRDIRQLHALSRTAKS